MRRPRPAILLLAAGVVALGVVIAVGTGWRGLAVYAFFVGLATAVALGTVVGGDFLTGASRGRFDRRDDDGR